MRIRFYIERFDLPDATEQELQLSDFGIHRVRVWKQENSSLVKHAFDGTLYEKYEEAQKEIERIGGIPIRGIYVINKIFIND